MHAVLETVKPNHNAKFFCLCVSIPWQVGLSVKTKLVSNRNALNYTSLELSDLSSALRASLPTQHKNQCWLFQKNGERLFEKRTGEKNCHTSRITVHFYCCFSVSVLSSLFWFSSLFALSSPSSLSSPSFSGLVINSCLGNTSSPPPAEGRLLRCWPRACGCNVCGAAHPSLHTCLCTNPKGTKRTLRSPEGCLHERGHCGYSFVGHLDWNINFQCKSRNMEPFTTWNM